jgi:hypothetical protein
MDFKLVSVWVGHSRIWNNLTKNTTTKNRTKRRQRPHTMNTATNTQYFVCPAITSHHVYFNPFTLISACWGEIKYTPLTRINWSCNLSCSHTFAAGYGDSCRRNATCMMLCWDIEHKTNSMTFTQSKSNRDGHTESNI